GRLGEPIPLVERVDYNSSNGRVAASASASGALVFRIGDPSAASLAWFDRSGKVVSAIADVIVSTAGANSLRLSADDGQAVRVQRDEQQNNDVWQVDLRRNLLTKSTFDKAIEPPPVWSPDGRWVAFAPNRRGHADLFRKASGGVGSEEL